METDSQPGDRFYLNSTWNPNPTQIHKHHHPEKFGIGEGVGMDARMQAKLQKVEVRDNSNTFYYGPKLIISTYLGIERPLF